MPPHARCQQALIMKAKTVRFFYAISWQQRLRRFMLLEPGGYNVTAGVSGVQAIEVRD